MNAQVFRHGQNGQKCGQNGQKCGQNGQKCGQKIWSKNLTSSNIFDTL